MHLLESARKVFGEHWLKVVCMTAVGLALGALAAVITPREYSSTVTLYVSAQPGGPDTASSAYQGSLLSEQRIKSYTSLLTSYRVTGNALNRVPENNRNQTPAGLASAMTVDSPLNTTILNVSVEDPSPEQATEYANAVGQTFVELVRIIEQPANPQASPPVAVSIVQPALVPDAPSAPNVPLYLAIGLLAGIVGGALVAYLSARGDQTLRSSSALASSIELPDLGSVANSKDAASEGLFSASRDRSQVSEQIRRIRTNLQFLDVDGGRQVFLVTSSIPAEGKTAVSCALAMSLAEAGHSVALLEADLRRPALAELFGAERAIGLTTVLTGRCALSEAIQMRRKVALVSSGPIPPNPSELLGSHAMQRVLGELKSKFDYVLVDTPPVLPVADAVTLAPSCDGVILLCKYGSTSSVQARASKTALDTVGARCVGSVLTMEPTRGDRDHYSSYYPSVSSNESLDAETFSLKTAGNVSSSSETSASARPTPDRRSRG